nr:DnaJ C-terminal domain-containing protein [Actinacidiphila yanglinensis]
MAEAQAERDQAATELARLRGRVAEELATAREEAQRERERAVADAARIREQARAQAAAPGSGPDDQAGAEDVESSPGPRDRSGDDVVIPLEIALEEAAFGVTKDVEVDTAVACDRCGSQVPPARKCDVCRGRGEVSGITRSLLGQVMESRTCARCRGLGTVLPEPCPQCAGEGRVRSRRTRTVRLPAGIDSGTRIQLVGEGAAGAGGGPPGNVYLEIHVRPHEIFERRGDDLHCTITIPMTAAALGTMIPLETLDGAAEVAIRPGTQYGRTIPFPERGVTHLNGDGRGDLVVHVEVTVAAGLDSVQEDLLRRLARARGEEHPTGELTPGAQGFFSRLKDAFNGHQPM